MSTTTSINQQTIIFLKGLIDQQKNDQPNKALEEQLKTPPIELLNELKNLSFEDREEVIKQFADHSLANNWRILAYLSHWDQDWKIRLEAIKTIARLERRFNLPDRENYVAILGLSADSDGYHEVRFESNNLLSNIKTDTLGNYGESERLKSKISAIRHKVRLTDPNRAIRDSVGSLQG